MSDTNLPGGTGGDEALSFADGADAISDLLNPETDLEDEDQATDETEATENDADPEEGEAEAEEAEETDETESPDDEDEDGQQEYRGGKFASDDAKVTLKDGTVLSVQDLKRGFMSQQYFTRETQALSEEKKAFETQRSQVNEYARALNQQRDFLLQAAQQFLPKPPDKSMIDQDVFGYQHALADYQEKMQVVQHLQAYSAQEQARMQQEHEVARQEAIKREAQKLVEVLPELKNPETYRKFWSDAVDTMAEYGFSSEELDQAYDHRLYRVIRDIVKYRKARQAAPKVKQEIQAKPNLIKGGKRMDPKAKISRDRQAKSERLRSTGTFDAGVDALMDLID